MATEAEIRGAERARLEAIVAEHGTEREQFELLLSGVMHNGISVSQYAGDEPLGHLPPEPAFLAQIARRVERRAKLGLPAVECGGDPPTRYGCRCLEQALDECEGGKRAVLAAAASLHWGPPPRAEPAKPTEQPAPRREAEQEPPAAEEPTEQILEPKPRRAEPRRAPSYVWRSQRSLERGSEAVRFANQQF
jgi:hypothetical protein